MYGQAWPSPFTPGSRSGLELYTQRDTNSASLFPSIEMLSFITRYDSTSTWRQINPVEHTIRLMQWSKSNNDESLFRDRSWNPTWLIDFKANEDCTCLYTIFGDILEILTTDFSNLTSMAFRLPFASVIEADTISLIPVARCSSARHLKGSEEEIVWVRGKCL